MPSKEISRERLLNVGVAAFVGSLLNAACTPEKEVGPKSPPPVRLEAPTLARPVTDIEGARPLPHVDIELVKEIIKIESGYPRQDLLEPTIRQKHLELCAEFFARYSSEPLSKEELIKSVIWLVKEEYDKSHSPNSSAEIDKKTGVIYIRTEFPSSHLEELKKMRQTRRYWSALSRIRLTYWHEFFHRSSVVAGGRKPEEGINITYRDSEGRKYRLERIHALTLEYKDPQTGKVLGDPALTEAVVRYLTTTVERQMSGYLIGISVDEGINKETIIREITGVNNLNKFLVSRPVWEKAFQKAHRESDYFGLARFLADQTKITFKSELERGAYGVNVLGSITNPDPEVQKFFDSFLTRINS